jgi:hypothetical protein
MATDLSVLEFFTRLASEEGHQGPIVNEMPKLDIDLYINNYVGMARPSALTIHSSVHPDAG